MASAQVLCPGDVVIGRVRKLTSRQVVVDIWCVRETVFREPFPGVLRLEDVRTHDVDKLALDDVFAPDALVKAVAADQERRARTRSA